MNLADRDTLCFGCGKDNPIGLHMHFKVDEEGCYASFVPQPVHQSYDGRMHGALFPRCWTKPWGITLIYMNIGCLYGTAGGALPSAGSDWGKISIITKVKKRKGILLEMTGRWSGRTGPLPPRLMPS